MKRTLAGRDLVRERRRRARDEGDAADAPTHLRPQRRADCIDGPRPCPFVGCRYHLYLDVQPRSGSIKINFPGREPGDLEHTCALDVASRGGVPLSQVGKIFGVTRERIRQIEERALANLDANLQELEANPQACMQPLSDNQTLEALGLGTEKKWLTKLWSTIPMSDELPFLTSTTDSE